MRRSIRPKRLVGLSLLVVLVSVLGGAAVATGSTGKTGTIHATMAPSTVYGPFTPTYTGPAATGCASGCSLLSGPYYSPSTASASSASRGAAASKAGTRSAGLHAMPGPTFGRHLLKSGVAAQSPTPIIPNVRCSPIGSGCDVVSGSNGGAVGVKGLKAPDSGELPTNPLGDIEPPDQGLCAGNGYVVETNNIGEILVFNTALARESAPISDDTLMGLTSRGWSSGGDPSCEYDPSNGGHFFFTEIVSSDPESAGGTFAGCFAAAANSCYEGIAVSKGNSPFGPYYVYFLNANYDPAEPGYPYLLNDFAKIGTTRDAFMLFYDEFALRGGGMGGGGFNGAQEYAFDKNAMEHGAPTKLSNGGPNPYFNVARENMGTLATPDGTCAGSSGVDCWVAVIPAQPADSGQWDNHYGGSGFMVSALDFNSFATLPSSGDNRMATWYWAGLQALDSARCDSCGAIKFGGDLFTNTDPYYNPENAVGDGYIVPQKAGPIPLGDECGPAGLASVPSCPENGLNTNGDFTTEASQGQGQLWTAMSTEVNQLFNGAPSEIHGGAIYWVISTRAFDRTGRFMMTNQGYASAAHEDLNMPAMAAEGTGGNGKAIMLFTLSGNGGPSGADNGGFYPSTAYGRLTALSDGLTGSTINVADLGQSPQDGFSEYQFYPGTTRPRWGDYSWGIFLPGGGDRLYFANEYIQYPNCTTGFNYAALGTCGGTRDGFANWGTSVNYVVP
jgi:hypothetical protein